MLVLLKSPKYKYKGKGELAICDLMLFDLIDLEIGAV